MEKENIYIDTINIGKILPLTLHTIESIFSDYHEPSCCEHHWIAWDESKEAVETASKLVPWFDTVELSGVPDMWILLRFSHSFYPDVSAPVFFAGHNSNNWYYSYNLSLIVKLSNGFKKEYDISSYQD